VVEADRSSVARSPQRIRPEEDGVQSVSDASPVMSFVYEYEAPAYREHMNREGELILATRVWHEANGTYEFAYLLGSVIGLSVSRTRSRVIPRAVANRQLAALARFAPPKRKSTRTARR
jgi:hypothetical protein